LTKVLITYPNNPLILIDFKIEYKIFDREIILQKVNELSEIKVEDEKKLKETRRILQIS